MTAALRTIGLTKEYGDRVALQPLNVEVLRGQRVALIGHNGSGKTTLLRMAAGLLEPTSGRVDIVGARAGSLEARRAVSWISDTPTFYDDLSLLEHLEYVARLHGVADWRPLADDLLERLGLAHRADDLPVSFSRGLRQRSALALGLVRPSQVVMVDEPFVGLDTAGKAALLELLDEAARRGATLVVATHEMVFLDRVDRVLVLEEGALIADGPPGSIETGPAVRSD